MRTTVKDVKGIIQTGLTDPEIGQYMVMANRMVTDVLAGESVSDDRMKDIESWLTCHLIAMSKERQTREERIGDTWIKFNENKNLFMEATTYGQMVLFLDPTGNFQASSRRKASVTAISQERGINE